MCFQPFHPPPPPPTVSGGWIIFLLCPSTSFMTFCRVSRVLVLSSPVFVLSFIWCCVWCIWKKITNDILHGKAFNILKCLMKLNILKSYFEGPQHWGSYWKPQGVPVYPSHELRNTRMIFHPVSLSASSQTTSTVHQFCYIVCWSQMAMLKTLGCPCMKYKIMCVC